MLARFANVRVLFHGHGRGHPVVESPLLCAGSARTTAPAMIALDGVEGLVGPEAGQTKSLKPLHDVFWLAYHVL
eukprot:801508-Prorocentrum_lima.AAC.1